MTSMTPHLADRPAAEGVDVVATSPRWADAGLDLDALAREALAAAAGELGVDPARPLAVAFADDALLAELNGRHRGADGPTNVLAFPAPAPPVLLAGVGPAALGDIVLAYETIAAEAAELGLPLRARTLHMVVHGYLHLCGYDHQTDDDADRMEAMERKALARLGVDDPYRSRDDA